MDNVIAKAQEIKGWMSLEELAWLHETSKQMGDILELGCHRGRTTYVLCAGCPGQVYAIDCHWCGTMHPFEDSEVYTFPEFMANVGHFPNMVAFEGNFMEAAVSERIPPMVDMTFVDGSHEKPYVLLDLQTWGPRTRKLLCGHDLDPTTPGVEQALQEFCGMRGVQRGPGKIWYIQKGE